MKKILFFVLIAASMSACSSLKVTSDYDGSANFANYKTYAFTEESGNLAVDQLNRDRIIRATEAELAGKGFSKSDNPDVLVDLVLKTQQRTEAIANTYGGAGWGRYGYGMGYSTTQVSYNQYTDGTLFITIVDISTQKVAWQGRATDTLNPDASPEKKEANINYAVKQIFTKYPPAPKK